MERIPDWMSILRGGHLPHSRAYVLISINNRSVCYTCLSHIRTIDRLTHGGSSVIDDGTVIQLRHPICTWPYHPVTSVNFMQGMVGDSHPAGKTLLAEMQDLPWMKEKFTMYLVGSNRDAITSDACERLSIFFDNDSFLIFSQCIGHKQRVNRHVATELRRLADQLEGR